MTGSSFGSPVLASLIAITWDGTNVSTYPSPCYTTHSAFSCVFSAPTGSGGPNNVTAKGASTMATATFFETGVLWLSPAGVDVGQNASVAGGGYIATYTITDLTLGGKSLNCTAATVGSCASGVITTNTTGWFNATFVAPSVSSSGRYEVLANASTGKSESGNITIDLDPVVAEPSASPASVDVGQAVSLSAAASRGSGGYSYNWSGFPGCPGNTNPTVCTPTTPGVLTITARVTDSNGYEATSPPLNLTVYPDPRVSTPTATPGTVDANQSVTLATSPAAGTGQYRAFTWAGLPTGCTGQTATIRCTPVAAGVDSISVTVTDSNGRTSASSGTLAFTVSADPVVPLPSPNRSSADVGQVVSFSSSVSRGSGGYSYAWSGLPADCVGASPTAVCAVTAEGTYSIQLRVVDSNGYGVTSGVLGFQTYNDPTVRLRTLHGALDSDQPFSLNGTVANGSGGITYAWTGLPAGCQGSSLSVTCLNTVPGSYSVLVRVRDSNGVSAVSAPVAMTVAPRLAASIFSSRSSPAVGEAVTFSSNSSGGTGPFTYDWSFGDRTNGTGSTVHHSFGAPGTYTVILWLNDSVGASLERSARVTVLSSPATVAPSGVGAAETPWAIGAIAAVAIIIAVSVLLLRRRLGQGERTEDSDLARSTEERMEFDRPEEP